MSTHTGLKRRIAIVTVVGIALIAWGIGNLHSAAVSGFSAFPIPQSQEAAVTLGAGFGIGSAGGSETGTVGSEGIQAPPLPPELVVPVVTSKSADQIIHETLDPLHVAWTYDCGDLGTNWGNANWDVLGINGYIFYSNIEICLRKDLPAEHARWTALHEYGHILQARVLAAQSPFIGWDQLEAKASSLFDASVNNAHPEFNNPHVEILADCEAWIMNGRVWENTNVGYTHDCSGARGTAALAVINGQLPS